jgi:iron complex outermembrane receptor protein
MKRNRLSSVVLLAFVLTVTLFSNLSLSQDLAGTVINEDQDPLPNVNVFIPALQRGTTTNSNGRFAFQSLPPGVYTVRFSFIGYRTESRTVNLFAGDTTLTVVLYVSPLEVAAITVTAKPQPTDILTSPQAVTVVEGRQLDRQRGQSVVQSIEDAPGVSIYSTGAGIVKPVIRGLTSQRVLVVADGIRQEGQQWGDEHSPEVDPLDVERVEVVRGPSSVLYGSDALGGVINIVRGGVLSASEEAPRLGGRLLLNGFTNNRQGAGALALYGRSGILGYRTTVSYRSAGDISTPAGKLFNSGMKSASGSGILGIQSDWGSVAVDYSRFDQKLQIHENPAEAPGATPFQAIQHDRAHLHGNFPLQNLRLEVDGSWQRNDRKEYEEKNAVVPVLNLVLTTTNLELKGHHQLAGSAFGTVGVSIMQQKNRTLAEEALIPGFNLRNLAAFMYEEFWIGNISLSAGLRFDLRRLNVMANRDLGVEAQTRQYSAVTGSAGLVWRAAQPFAIAVNIGRAWRAPTAYELFVDGVHEGTVRYEIGDNTMEPEVSLNVDLSVRYASDRLQAEFAVFQNRINRYIFLSPTGAVDPESGFRKYQHKQADATLVGGEFTLRTQVADWIVVNSGADLVRGTNEQTKGPLPLIPANRFKLGIRLTRPSLGKIVNPYLSFNAKLVGAQNRVEEYETNTEGYTLIQAAVGGEIPFGSHRLTVDLSVDNLFNKAYREHLSRYKEYALNPGRNITLRLVLPFDIIK